MTAKNLTDSFNRTFPYLRLSITEACNFRCNYCLPNGYNKRQDPIKPLTKTEITNLASAFSKLGTKKIRITGGEPTMRKDFVEIIESVANVEGIEKIALTTNAFKLAKNALTYKNAGVTSLNISLDSLNHNTFESIRGQNKLEDVLKGIEKAIEAGFKNIKLNVVLLNNVNSCELEDFIDFVKNKNVSLRFIELMQTIDNHEYFKKYHLSGSHVEDILIKKGWQKQLNRSVDDGPAIYYNSSESKGNIGLIMPYSKDFCKSCNRLRVSSKGDLFLCLFDIKGYSIREFLQNKEDEARLINHVISLLPNKREMHFLHNNDPGLRKHLASIGG